MKIDFVLPWVDGSDIEWIKEKQKYCSNSTSVDFEVNRYRDWDNLKYWFRGVETFAPWVNKIFFVTCGQCPDWLNKEHEKLVFVNHKDYIPAEYLPTFSANPIELNLHRITELSEHFVYFNDDFFLISPTTSTDFFSSEGLPCDLFVEEPLIFENKDVFNSILVNDMVMINSHFDRQEVLRTQHRKVYTKTNLKTYIKNKSLSLIKRNKFFGIEYSHLPQPFLKSVFNDVWSDNPEDLYLTCSNRFRSVDDVNQYVIKFYQLLTGRFTPYDIRKNGLAYQLYDVGAKNNIDDACRDISSGKYKMICLNDSNVQDFESTKCIINNALERVLPHKSSFEL